MLNLGAVAANLFTSAGPNNLNRGIKNMGIGPQGRDRSLSTQSGFMMGPSLKQQADEQKKNKLLISKIVTDMLKKKQQLKEETPLRTLQSKPYEDTP
jgi:hypothetical protein